jgi:putative MFS transporter
VPDVEPHLFTVLGLVTLALFFEAYDLSMLTAALPRIAPALGMTEADLPSNLAAIRLGALPAFLLIPLTDRLGRRRMFLASVVGVSVCTFLTAFAQTSTQWVVMQMCARPFVLTGAAVAVVIVTEEFPAAHRGWALGMMGALSSTGHGLGALLFGAIDHLPFGWRFLYALGALPLILLPRFIRELRETRRFTAHQERTAGTATETWLAPLRHLLLDHPRRTLGLSLAVVLVSIADAASFQFTSYFTSTAHGWTPAQYSTMVLLGGAIGILGNLAAGRLGDRFGRRIVGGAFMTCFPLFVWAFYRGPGWILPPAWSMFVFCDTASIVTLRALSTELFPTSHRGTAAGLISLVQTLALAGGLYAAGLGPEEPGSIARTASWLSLASIGAALALFTLPETNQRELETISRD